MKQMSAKFNSKCAETGKALRKGDVIYYDPSTKKAYHPSAKAVTEIDREAENIKAYVQAQEDAYFDRFVSYDRY